MISKKNKNAKWLYTISIITVVFFLAPLLLTGQIMPDTTAAPPIIPDAAAKKEMSVFELLMKGGIVMVPIVLLLGIALYLFIERMLFIGSRTGIDRNFMINVKNMVYRGDVQGAIMTTQTQRNALGEVISAAIHSLGRPAAEMDANIESVASYELARMEKNLGYLGIIAGVAPMLGFIGTISGIINIFYNISISDNISIGIIAGGLYEKMVSSGSGLVVGILAYTFYHLLSMRVDHYSLKLEGNILEFKRLLNEPAL